MAKGIKTVQMQTESLFKAWDYHLTALKNSRPKQMEAWSYNQTIFLKIIIYKLQIKTNTLPENT
jgi:hypothetical protein